MARGVNKAIIIGNLGRDPELRQTINGNNVVNFSVATTEKHNGEESTEWHNIVAFGKTAENCNQYLSKGSTVYLEGKIQTRKWQDRDGNDRYTTEIVAFNVQFLGGKSDNQGQQQNRQSNSNQGSYDPNSDLPF